MGQLQRLVPVFRGQVCMALEVDRVPPSTTFLRDPFLVLQSTAFSDPARGPNAAPKGGCVGPTGIPLVRAWVPMRGRTQAYPQQS